ncbi:hypothetical protein niasHS_007147 [Heterodera schachtii]|uniref:Histone-lysine N-methyltransferase n=1 Tax=Heterodera schachtii TaxID=97005 RepID=A0ABD2JL63_HETSC
MDDLIPSSAPSSSSIFASTNKKKKRIDSVALALANRMSSSLSAGPTLSFVNSTNPGPSTVDAQVSQCSVCRLALDGSTTAKTCPMCKRRVHADCVASDAATASFFEPNTCAACCSKSSFSPLLVANDALLSSSSVAAAELTAATPADEHSMRSQSLGAGVGHDQQTAGDTQCDAAALLAGMVDFCATVRPSSRGAVRDRMALVEQQRQFPAGGCVSSPRPSSGTPTSRSSTPLFPQDGECSDNDEYHPPGTIVRRTESTRGGRGKGRKPSSATLHRQSSTSMRTRSFGKPPSSVASTYTAKFDAHFKAEEKPGGKKSRGNASKGKGGNRGRRPAGAGGGRGSKLVSMYANALTAAAAATASGTTASQREHSSATTVDERRKEEDGGGSSNVTDKEYIRTCVVTSLEDKFMTEVSMCLVCGSIGRGTEGSMITCSCCAQSFHTYCVLMHDKLNPTVMKRGWRCLDCTVCEGCGSGEDEPNLLLCDECDISYHTYCLEPPLDCIPRGSWRCKWCATCSRCGAQIKFGSDMQRLEGFCEICYSLRKCVKCQASYEIGDLMLKCGRCLRWLHARCEGLTTEEQAENAAENAFRCSFCRPQIFHDASNVPVVVDNVMVSKSMVDQIQGISNIRKLAGLANFGEHFGNIARSVSCEQDDMELSDELQEQLIASVFAGRGRGCGSGGGRGGGPGRRMLKMGVGGFYVRTPKSRLPFLMGSGANMTPMNSTEDEQQQQMMGANMLEEDLGPNGKPRIRRPRKLKRPLLEDAYPPQIQESFFGVAAVDSRTLAEQTVDEPTLGDYKKVLPVVSGTKFASELSEHSAELLRTEQEMDMLGDIPLVENIMDGLDMEGLDFSDLIVGEEDEPMTVESSSNTIDPISDGYNAGSSSNLVAHSVVSEVFSPSSCSSIRTPSRVFEPGPPPMAAAPSSAATAVFLQQNNAPPQPPIGQQQQTIDNGDGGGKMMDQQQKQSASALTTERWEEDEPLGDKATKAAVLYANVHHTYLKDKFPIWTDRVRMISRIWRDLNPEKRQEFVEWARKNRANCPTTRRRGRRTVSTEVAHNQQQQGAVQNQQPPTPRTAPVLIGQQQPDAPFKGGAAKAMGMVIKEEQKQPGPMLHHQQHRELFSPQHLASSSATTTIPNPLNNNRQPPPFAAMDPSKQCGNNAATGTSTTIHHHNLSASAVSSSSVPFNPPMLPAGGVHTQKRQQQSMDLEHDFKVQEARLEQLKKDKRALAARQRLLQKKTHPMAPEEANRHAEEVRAVQNNFEVAKKALQVQQRLVDKQRQRLKEQQQKQSQAMSAQSTSVLADPNGSNTTTSSMTSTQHPSMIGQQQHSQQRQQKPMMVVGQQQQLPTQTQQQQQQKVVAERTRPPSTTTSNVQQHQQQPTTSGFLSSMHLVEQQQKVASQTSEHGQQRQQQTVATPTLGEQKPIIGVGQQQQVKGTRGRKRKKPLPENVRSSVLGGVPFTALGTQLERDVYETVDILVGFVAAKMDSSSSSGAPADDNLLVQKILSQQNNNTNNGINAIAQQCPGKVKKRRQTQTKTRSQPDTTNELDLIQERIKKTVELIPPINNYMEQYQANDKQMMKYPDQSALPDHEGSEPPLHGNATGEYTLPFMPDYYDELETVREYVDEETLLPPTMGEICWNVDFDALAKDTEDPSPSAVNGENSDDVKDFPPVACLSVTSVGGNNDEDEKLLNFLSIDQIGNRSKIVKSVTLLGAPGPSQETPLEPHWSRFDEEPRDLDRMVDVVLTVDPSVMPRDEFVDSLCQILGIPHIDHITELDTPPYTPDSPRNDGGGGGYYQSLAEHTNQKQHKLYYHHQQQTIKSEIGETTVGTELTATDRNNGQGNGGGTTCKHCNSVIPPGKTPIDDTHGRLGLLSESKDEKIHFCSMQCYYKFLALFRIPLSVESLEMAERYVDNVTLETLRQISADNFAKRINAGFTPQAKFLGEQQQHSSGAAASASIVQTATTSGANSTTTLTTATVTIDGGAAVAQREFLIKSSELPALLMIQQSMEKKRVAQALHDGGFKWRGFGWNICDTTLVQSFRRQYDGTKQQFAAVHLQTNEKRMNWSEDSRQCSFCEQIGDGDQRLTGRLLNVDANKWVHVNCALWSAEVHVAEDGGLINVEAALRRAKVTECRLCGLKGASIRCYKLDCANNELAFHLICAKHSHGHFVKDKTFFCAEHDIRPDAVVTDLSALRRLFVQRDENQLLSKIFNHSYRTEMVMRVGSLIFHRIGQLLPDQLKAFTTEEHIFPVGYRVTRLFWSTCDFNDRVRYECAVVDGDGKPEFRVKNVDHENATTETGSQQQMPQEQSALSPTTAWAKILHAIADFRAKNSSEVLRFFPKQMSGEYLFGFLEPSISKMLESLPGIDQLYTYTFKHGGTPLMDLPLAENPSGCARCEPCFRTLVKQRHRPIISNSPKKSIASSATVFGSDAVVSREGRSTRNNSARFVLSAKFDQEMLRAYRASGISERMLFQTPYLRSNDMAQLVVQYREMKRECKSNVYLARSKIQGMGLYAKRDLDMNQMIIEYIGELIRNEVCEIRQSRYIEQNRGEYMFRIDCDWVVDATMAGGLARYINHSCDPNCGTKILPVNDEKKVVIFANRPIKAGEELTYDYQFDIEETGKKIPCLCGAPNCVKWMN